ncbi:MAG: NDP-sugar synthase [Anaerolineaceae bacterium]|nr:MAG: NDP-sugar synthase [Anaerolineaceae bacterium]
MVNHAVILAIGNTHNHSKLTYNRSHSMLPALGKPIFVRTMERLYRFGIREYTVVIGEAEGAVASYLNGQWMPDVKINLMFCLMSDSLPVTMRQIAEKIQSPFVVCSYNSFMHTYFPERLMRLHSENPSALIFSGAPKTLSHTPTLTHGIVEDKQVLRLSDHAENQGKSLILNDLFICGGDMLDYLGRVEPQVAKTRQDLHFMDVATTYLNDGGAGLIAEANWVLQVIADRDLLTLNKMLLDEGQDTHILSELPYTVKVMPPVRIDPQVSVGQGAQIGPHVYLERGASVGHDAVVQNSMVLARANVPAERTIVNTILTTRGPIN